MGDITHLKNGPGPAHGTWPLPLSNHPHKIAEGSLIWRHMSLPHWLKHTWIPYRYFILILLKLKSRALYGSLDSARWRHWRSDTRKTLKFFPCHFELCPSWTCSNCWLSTTKTPAKTCQALPRMAFTNGNHITLAKQLQNSIQCFLCNHTLISKHTNKQSESVGQLIVYFCTISRSLGRNNHTNLSNGVKIGQVSPSKGYNALAQQFNWYKIHASNKLTHASSKEACSRRISLWNLS